MKMRFPPSFLLAAWLVTGPMAVAAAPDPAYPSLDDKQLGALRNTVALAQQAHDDWRGFEVGPRGAFDQLQFQIAWMHYGLAVAQSQLTPAYRELYQSASVRLIEKMTEKTTWDFWHVMLQQPRFSKYVGPSDDLADPVKDKNIMYSGHLLQMIGLHGRLYRDHRYDEPGSITFSHAGEGFATVGVPGTGFHSSYSHHELAHLIHEQFVESQFVGIECEPNFVFAECNQHPILGLIDYDQVHGTNLADIREAFWEKAEEIGFLNEETQRFAGPYTIEEAVTWNNPSVWNDGWTGITMHAWNREVVSEVYPAQRDAALPALISTSPEVIKRRWAERSVSSDFGFLAAYAAEVSDMATRQKLLEYADSKLNPAWQDGRYFYPRHDVAPANAADAGAITGSEELGERPVELLSDDQLNERMVNRLAGNALLTFARVNTGGGLWNLYNRLEATYAEAGPELVDVDYPRALVSQAYFDQSKQVLAVNLVPGTDYKGKISFSVRNLSHDGNYDVVVDGRSAGTISRGSIDLDGSDVVLNWNPQNNNLTVELPLQDGRGFILKQISAPRSASTASSRHRAAAVALSPPFEVNLDLDQSGFPVLADGTQTH